MKKYLLTLFVVFSLVPVLSFAADEVKLDYSGLVQCDGVVAKNNAEPNRTTVCDFAALLNTVKYLVNWLFVITIPIITVIIAYGGYLYMTGVQKNISQAHSIFESVAIGFIIMLVAWFAVVTVVNWFIVPGSGADIFVDLIKK